MKAEFMSAVLTFTGILAISESLSHTVTVGVVTAIGDRQDKKVSEWRNSLDRNFDSRVYIIIGKLPLYSTESAGDIFT